MLSRAQKQQEGATSSDSSLSLEEKEEKQQLALEVKDLRDFAIAQIKSSELHTCAFCLEECGEKHPHSETWVTPANSFRMVGYSPTEVEGGEPVLSCGTCCKCMVCKTNDTFWVCGACRKRGSCQWYHTNRAGEVEPAFGGEIPNELKVLNFHERRLVSIYVPFCTVYTKLGQRHSRGNNITFEHSPEDFVYSLPRSRNNGGVVILKKHDQRTGVVSEHHVNSERMRNALVWLQANNSNYSDITIDENNLAEWKVMNPFEWLV